MNEGLATINHALFSFFPLLPLSSFFLSFIIAWLTVTIIGYLADAWERVCFVFYVLYLPSQGQLSIGQRLESARI